MSWRETWRETVASFLRELRMSDSAVPGIAGDPVASAIAAARAEVAELERQAAEAESRLAAEQESAARCERRRARAEQVGDAETAALARRFGRQHEQRAAVLARKREVLADELRLAREAMGELLDYLRSENGSAIAEREGRDP